MDGWTDRQTYKQIDIMGREAGRLAGKQMDILTNRMTGRQTDQERRDIERE